MHRGFFKLTINYFGNCVVTLFPVFENVLSVLFWSYSNQDFSRYDKSFIYVNLIRKSNNSKIKSLEYL